jgi:predicted esterase
MLREASAAVHFRSYPRVGHFTTPEEIEEVVSFFETALTAKANAAS